MRGVSEFAFAFAAASLRLQYTSSCCTWGSCSCYTFWLDIGGCSAQMYINLSGMFRRSALLAIPHRKSFAATPSVSRAHLEHTNRNVSSSYESQRKSCPRFGTWFPTKTGLCFAGGGILNSTWNYNSHETTTLECSNSTSWGPKAVTVVKWRLLHPAIIERQQLHSQQPPNYNNSEPTAVKWRVRSSTIAATRAWDFASLHGCCRFKCL